MTLLLLWGLCLALGSAIGYASAVALRGRGPRFVAVGAPFVILFAAAAIPIDRPWPAPIVLGIAGALGIVGLEAGLAAYTLRRGTPREKPQQYVS